MDKCKDPRPILLGLQAVFLSVSVEQQMRKRVTLISIVFALSLTWAPSRVTGFDMSLAAENLLSALSDSQRQQMTYPLESEERIDWHFVPKKDRKGLPLKAMSIEQTYLVNILLNESLGQAGYSKTIGIMHLESILRGIDVERGREGAYEYRDPTRYFVTIFGNPQPNGPWAWSFEGHHISLNFTIVDGNLIASSPAFFGANPHRVPSGPMQNLRVLGSEEDSARRLLDSLDDDQLKKVVIGELVPKNIFSAANPRIIPDEPKGIKSSELTPSQSDLLLQLIDVYIENVANEGAMERRAQVATGDGEIYFAWIGSHHNGEAHYYRIQAPSFLIEYDNIQNDANHSHTVWRDYDGDFGRDLIGEHRQTHIH
jgi:hypothetical protein